MDRFIRLTILFFLVITSPIFAHGDKAIIRMTANGFEPQQITIDTNQLVVFVNEDKENHWPASDFHPTHELYSEFDPKQPIQSEKSWEFQPQRAGTWKYHDHLFPHRRGTLIVTSEGKHDSPSIASSLLARLWQWVQDVWQRLHPVARFSLPSVPEFKGFTYDTQQATLTIPIVNEFAN